MQIEEVDLLRTLLILKSDEVSVVYYIGGLPGFHKMRMKQSIPDFLQD
jgi:hypothetical protein